MAGENEALFFLTDDLFLDFCKVAVLDAAHDGVLATPTSSGVATFALLATTDPKVLEEYKMSLARGLLGNPAVQTEAAGGKVASAINWNVYQTAAQLLRDEIWGPEAAKGQRSIPGTT